MNSMHLDTYRQMVSITSSELREKLKKFLSDHGYRKSTQYTFKNKELEELTGIKVVWWGNWTNKVVPAHIFLLLHLKFNIDLKEFFATGELKKISREGREDACA